MVFKRLVKFVQRVLQEIRWQNQTAGHYKKKERVRSEWSKRDR